MTAFPLFLEVSDWLRVLGLVASLAEIEPASAQLQVALFLCLHHLGIHSYEKSSFPSVLSLKNA